jgi:putrescine aminotransferase
MPGEPSRALPAAADVPGLYARHVDPALVKLLGVFGYGRVFVRAEGTRLWDREGREYLDFLAGFGSTNLGHNHPRILRRIREFLDASPVNLSHTGPAPLAAELAARLAEAAGPPFEIALFSNSGAEAVEEGLKLARAATGRPEFLACEGGFHGKSLGTVSVGSDPRARRSLAPLLAGCSSVPFGDLAALERALAPRKAAAFLVEPVQCEGGVRFPPPGYLRAARDACEAAGTVLVLDEVQTGLARTGALFAFQSEGFVPDVLVLAKSLGGGLVAAGATLVTPALFERAYGRLDRFDLHGSTFAGNALACAAALETLEVLRDEGLAENSRVLGDRMLAGLRAGLAGHPFVKEVRGRGLLAGVELGPTWTGPAGRLAPGLVRLASRHVFGQWAALRMLERGVVCQPASIAWNVLRLEPPLTVRAEEVDRAVAALVGVLGEYRSLAALLADAAKRIAGQWARDWEFR